MLTIDATYTTSVELGDSKEFVLSKLEALPDAASLRHLVEMMPAAERNRFQEFHCLELEAAFPGRVMVVFGLKDGQPIDIEQFTVQDFSVPKGGEPQIGIRYQCDGAWRTSTVGMTPKRFSNREVFLSIPQKFEFRWAGRMQRDEISFQPHFALLIKTSTKLFRMVDGETYCCSLKRFITEFPKAADQVRY